jgi:hypothetical protein
VPFFIETPETSGGFFSTRSLPGDFPIYQKSASRISVRFRSDPKPQGLCGSRSCPRTLGFCGSCSDSRDAVIHETQGRPSPWLETVDAAHLPLARGSSMCNQVRRPASNALDQTRTKIPTTVAHSEDDAQVMTVGFNRHRNVATQEPGYVVSLRCPPNSSRALFLFCLRAAELRWVDQRSKGLSKEDALVHSRAKSSAG